MKSCIYRGTVRHRRTEPVQHDFTYPLFMMYLDLEELPTIFAGRWMWSVERPAPAWFRRADYLGDARIDLGESVRVEAERLSGSRPTGPIRMLTHLRYFGYVMNPVSFYYCFDPTDSRVETVLAEITNTPWNERHTYALSATGPKESACETVHRFGKAFHISPFMPMEQEYEWRLSEPRESLSVRMKNHTDSGKVFEASLSLHRRRISGRSLAGALAAYPWMTARVAAGIYWQAFRLWLKRTPYYEHPDQHAA